MLARSVVRRITVRIFQSYVTYIINMNIRASTCFFLLVRNEREDSVCAYLPTRYSLGRVNRPRGSTWPYDRQYETCGIRLRACLLTESAAWMREMDLGISMTPVQQQQLEQLKAWNFSTRLRRRDYCCAASPQCLWEKDTLRTYIYDKFDQVSGRVHEAMSGDLWLMTQGTPRLDYTLPSPAYGDN